MGNNRRRRILMRSSALAGALSLALGSAALGADERVVAFDLPAQPLGESLRDFYRASGEQIVFSESIVAGRRNAPLKGDYTPDQALALLLDGTNLTARRTSTGVVMIEAPQSGSAAGDGAESGTVEALIVTAQKREEDIQDVPIAISAFSQEALETHQIAGGPDLITQVPNMTFTKTNFSSYNIQIRGIGTQAISATTDPAVAVAFNNTPFIQNRFFEQEFYDLQRVEVLRGPQGTLYGRNATAGVVNIISAKPKFIAEAKLSGDVANYNTTRLEGMVNIPLVEDMVAVRLAGAWTKRDGYATNEITGNPIDGRDLWSTRLSLRFAPSDRLDVNLIWEHFEESDDRLRSGKQLCKKHVVTEVGGVQLASFEQTLPEAGQGSGWPAQTTFSQGCLPTSLYSDEAFQTPNGVSVPYYVPLSFIGLPRTFLDPYVNQTQSRDLRVIESTVDPIYKAEADLGELQASFDLTDSLTLTSETGYAVDFVYSLQDFNRFNTAPLAWRDPANPGGAFEGYPTQFDWYVARGILEQDGSFCDPQIGCTSRLVAVDLSTAESRQFSQEFRLASSFDGPFNFSLGANFTRFDVEAKYYVFINSLTLTSLESNGLGSSVYTPLSPYQMGISDNSELLTNGLLEGDPLAAFGYIQVYVEPNSIANIQDQGHNYFLSKNPYKLISYAVFGEAYYSITDSLKVTAGLRWTVDRKHAPRIPSWTLVGNTVGYPTLEVIDQEWREPTGRLAIDWKPDLSFTDETLLYASYAHGYKAGGANPPPMTPVGQSSVFYGREHISETRPKTFAAEFIDAFELGAKNTMLDGQLTLNLAAFYYDYKDYQISEIVDRSAFNRNFDATIWGIEIEADWRPLENLKLGFKGGYENTRIADGERAIDLMDRTAGNPDWIVVRPFPTFASSCVLPVALYTHQGSLIHTDDQGNQEVIEFDYNPNDTLLVGLGGPSGGNAGGCELAYQAGRDPVTNLDYVPWPTVFASASTGYSWPNGGVGSYPGWNPLDAAQGHNNGEGFFKDLSGNHLPNAPEFTATITADYTVPLPSDWLMTLHTDLYWQAESWWRVFDDKEFDKLDEYFTTNLAAIFTNEDAGWKVMAYVKNIFDRDSITGAFLNSDDTGLTTNVFLTEPRLYGLRVTKEWTGGPIWGSFGSRHERPYPFTVEIGGQVQRHDAPNEAVAPSFSDAFSDVIDPLPDQQDDLDWGDGREVKLIYQPNADWKVSLGARFGKTNGSMPWSRRKEFGDQVCSFNESECIDYPELVDVRYNYSISSTTDREEHTIIDFAIGKDFGLGVFDESILTAGLRHADLGSTTTAHIFGVPNWNITVDNDKYYPGLATHDRYDATINADRSFKGLGPVLSWDVYQRLLGNPDAGFLSLDWSVSGGVLFGERKTDITGTEVQENFDTSSTEVSPIVISSPTTTIQLPDVDIHRSEDVTAPTFGVSLGLSYKVDRFKVGAGYRWERYQDAIDGGYSETQEEDRTIDGPYLKVSVGFGG